jgi:hypothetical protein
MIYPGHIITNGEKDAELVLEIKRRLNEALEPAGKIRLLDDLNPTFEAMTIAAVKLFQARHVDAAGHPLQQDGQIGPLTWAALFDTGDHEYAYDAPTALLRNAIDVAGKEAEAGIREVPRNSNRGPRIETYLKSIDLPGGLSWCAAFVYWCFKEASRRLAAGTVCPLVKTGGCLDHWNRCEASGARRLKAADALQNPGLLRPGHIFIMDHGRGLGHTGVIERISGGLLYTIEGNTDASKTREGGGVYRLTRKVGEINKGFIDYSKAPIA